jgi:hypothetical protein
MGRPKGALKKELLDLEPSDRAEVAEEALRSLDGTAYGEHDEPVHLDHPGERIVRQQVAPAILGSHWTSKSQAILDDPELGRERALPTPAHLAQPVRRHVRLPRRISEKVDHPDRVNHARRPRAGLASQER